MVREIATYNSVQDPHCAAARTPGKQKHLLNQASNARSDRGESREASRNTPGSRRPRQSLASSSTSNGRGTGSKSVSTAHSGVTFQRPSGTDPAREVEVLKCIVLRENYIERLKKLAQRPIGSSQDHFVDLVELARTVTLETIEGIARWRRGAPPGSEFIWNGVNYLLRVPSDLDFLNSSLTVRSWLGTSAERNPFMISRNLDQSPASSKTTEGQEGSDHKIQLHGKGSCKRKLVGGGSSQVSKKRSRGAPTGSRGAASGTGGGDKSNPYATPIVNDPGMKLQKVLPGSPQGEQKRQQALERARNIHGEAEATDISTPKVKIDMIRVLEAEKILLQEEEMYGEWTRNEIGKLVPVLLGKDEDNVHGTRTRAVEVRQGSLTSPSNKMQARRATSSMSSPASTEPEHSQGNESSEPSASTKSTLQRNWPEDVYTREKAKQAGELTVLGKKGATGRRQVPMRRNRAAQIELEIRRAKKENCSLAEELHNMKTSLQRAREELDIMRAVELQEELTSVAPVANSMRASTREALVQESYVLRTEEEIARRSAELEHKERLVARKEAVRDDFRKRQRADQARMREETIAAKRQQGEEFSKHVDIDPSEQPQHQEPSSVCHAMATLMKDTGPDAVLVGGHRSKAESLAAENELDVEERTTLAQPHVLPESAAAMQIQRIVRGKLGRVRFINAFKTRSAAALALQSWRRMIKGQRRAAQVKLTRDSAVRIQSTARGMASRLRVRNIRLANLRHFSSVRIQRFFRGCKGRRRAKNKIRLASTGSNCMAIVNSMYNNDLLDLAKVKADEVEPILHTLIRCCLIITARGSRAPVKGVEQLINWKACKRALRRRYFLDKIKALALSAKRCCMFLHPGRVAAVKRHFLDPNLTSKKMALVKRGSRVAQLLIQWLESIVRCHDIIPEFLEPNAERSDEWLAVLATDDPLGLELWEPSEDDYDSDKIDPAKYVPEEVLRCHISRPRPMVLVLGLDIPAGPRAKIVEQVKTMFPGTFAHVGKERFTMDNLQEVLNGGYSIMVDADVGIGGRERNAFVRKMLVTKTTLEPRPLFILVKGDNRNRGRRGLNASIANAGDADAAAMEHANWPPAMLLEEEAFTGVMNITEESAEAPEKGAAPSSIAAARALSAGLATTAFLKRCLEDRSSCEFLLASPSSSRQMIELGQEVSPPESLVLLLETIAILLTPERVFQAPEDRVGAVSWEQSSPLLLMPAGFLSKRLASIDIDDVPMENLLAIQAYMRHKRFPILGLGGDKPAKKGGAAALAACNEGLVKFPIARTLLWWVESVTRYALRLHDEGGGGTALTKGSSDVFSSVITVHDGLQDFPPGYEPRQDHWPQRVNGDLLLQSDGWRSALVKISSIILRDMKVHSQSLQVMAHSSPISHLAAPSKQVGDENKRIRLIVSIHRDPLAQSFFFLGYDPKSCASYLAAVKDENVNLLLGPNSVEMRDPRQPPRNQLALYERLLELLTLERPQQRKFGAPPLPHQLVFRRKKLRLARTVRKVDSVNLTITASEAAPGEILLDAYAPATSKAYQARVDIDTVKRICRYSSSEREKRDLRSKQGVKMIEHVLDRVTLRRSSPGRPAEMSVHHGVVSGRKIYEGSVNISGKKHLVSVHVSTATKAMRVCTYLPSSSKRSEFLLSANAREQLLGSLNEGDRASCLEKLFARLHLHKPGSVSEFGRTMSGSSQDSGDSDERVVVLDKSLHKLSSRVTQEVTNEHGETVDGPAPLLLIEVCVSESAILIQGADDDDFYDDEMDDDTKLSNFRGDLEPREAIDILAFDQASGIKYKLALSQPQVDLLLAGNPPLAFSQTSECFQRIADSLRLLLGGKMVAIKDGTVIKDAKSKVPKVKKPESKAALDKNRLLPPLPAVISAELFVENIDVARSVPIAESSKKPPGEIIYQHGHRIGGKEGRHVIFTVAKQGMLDSKSGNRFHAAEFSPQVGYILQAYDPATRETSRLELMTKDMLRRAVGHRQDLLAQGKEAQLIAYLVKERLCFAPESVREEGWNYDDSEPSKTPLTLLVKQSKLAGLDKVTPVNKVEIEDFVANEHVEELVLLADGKHTPDRKRGIKLLSCGHNVPLIHEVSTGLTEYVILTAFETGEEDLFDEQGSGRCPTLRVHAYNPQRQTNVYMDLSGPNLFEALDGRRGFLAPVHRQQMVRELLPSFRIKRSLNPAKVPDVLVLPWEQLRRERKFSSPPPFKLEDPSKVRKLFSCGMVSRNGVPIIVTAQLARHTPEETKTRSADEALDENSSLDDDAEFNLWVFIYDSKFGQKTHVRVPKSERTAALLAAVEAGSDAETEVREMVTRFLKRKLIVERSHELGDGRVVISAYLRGHTDNLDKKFITKEDQALLNKREEEAKEDQEEDESTDLLADQQPGTQVKENDEDQREKLHLMPNVVSKQLLARRVAKVSNLYCVITVHELADRQDETITRGVLVRVYCPSIAQQASASRAVDSHVTFDDLMSMAKDLADKVDVLFDGVESHMKLKWDSQ